MKTRGSHLERARRLGRAINLLVQRGELVFLCHHPATSVLSKHRLAARLLVVSPERLVVASIGCQILKLGIAIEKCKLDATGRTVALFCENQLG